MIFFRSCSVKEMVSCFSLTVDEGFCDMSFDLLSMQLPIFGKKTVTRTGGGHIMPPPAKYLKNGARAAKFTFPAYKSGIHFA